MLVIVSVRRLENDQIEIAVARPQHDANHKTRIQVRKKRSKEVLSTFGISTEAVKTSHLKLLTQMGANEQLKFSPIDVPHQTLVSLGFRL